MVVDAYGPHVSIGGGAWSGKDPHKVDRVGGLFARHLALRAVRMGLGTEAKVTVGWFPGDSHPSIKMLELDGILRDWRLLGNVDASIDGIFAFLSLGSVRYASYSDGSWFQKSAPWNGQLTTNCQFYSSQKNLIQS